MKFLYSASSANYLSCIVSLKATVASGLSPSPVHIRHLCPLIALTPQYANLKKAPADGLQIHNVTDLAQNRYFDDEAFVGYLKYLLYWKRPEYAKFIVYVFKT
jgi:hypothetical protein